MEKLLLRLFGMRDEVWARQVNPWSVWTRMPVIALIALAIWARVWLGWWCLVPLAIIAFWIWVNPRLFPRPRTTQAWSSRSVLGERVWLERKKLVLSTRERWMPQVGNAVALVGLVVLAYGLIDLVAWAAVVGTLVTIGGKLYFLHEMTRIYAAHKDEDPVWAGWLY